MPMFMGTSHLKIGEHFRKSFFIIQSKQSMANNRRNRSNILIENFGLTDQAFEKLKGIIESSVKPGRDSDIREWIQVLNDDARVRIREFRVAAKDCEVKRGSNPFTVMVNYMTTGEARKYFIDFGYKIESVRALSAAVYSQTSDIYYPTETLYTIMIEFVRAFNFGPIYAKLPSSVKTRMLRLANVFFKWFFRDDSTAVMERVILELLDQRSVEGLKILLVAHSLHARDNYNEMYAVFSSPVVIDRISTMISHWNKQVANHGDLVTVLAYGIPRKPDEIENQWYLSAVYGYAHIVRMCLSRRLVAAAICYSPWILECLGTSHVREKLLQSFGDIFENMVRVRRSFLYRMSESELRRVFDGEAVRRLFATFRKTRLICPFTNNDTGMSDHMLSIYYGTFARSLRYVDRCGGDIREHLYNEIFYGLNAEEQKNCAKSIAISAASDRLPCLFEHMMQKGADIGTTEEGSIKYIFNAKARGEHDIIRLGPSLSAPVLPDNSILHAMSRSGIVDFATNPKYENRGMHMDLKIRYSSIYVTAFLIMNRLETYANIKRKKAGLKSINLNVVQLVDVTVMPFLVGKYPIPVIRKMLCNFNEKKRARATSLEPAKRHIKSKS